MPRDKETIQQELQKSDLELIRILEDLIEVLIIKGVLNYTDLPGPAMQKLLTRQKLRNLIRTISPLGESDLEDKSDS